MTVFDPHTALAVTDLGCLDLNGWKLGWMQCEMRLNWPYQGATMADNADVGGGGAAVAPVVPRQHVLE